MRYNLRKKTMTEVYYIAKALKDLQHKLEELTLTTPEATVEPSVLTRVANHVRELERLTAPIALTPSENTSIVDIEQTISAMTDIFYDFLLEDLDQMEVLKTRTLIGRNLIAENISIAGDLKNVMQEIDTTLNYHTTAYLNKDNLPEYPAYLTEKH